MNAAKDSREVEKLTRDKNASDRLENCRKAQGTDI